jgi:hypothetical protein
MQISHDKIFLIEAAAISCFNHITNTISNIIQYLKENLVINRTAARLFIVDFFETLRLH